MTKITSEELAMLLGLRDIEIFSLQKQLQDAMKKIAELEPKPDPAPETP